MRITDVEGGVMCLHLPIMKQCRPLDAWLRGRDGMMPGKPVAAPGAQEAPSGWEKMRTRMRVQS